MSTAKVARTSLDKGTTIETNKAILASYCRLLELLKLKGVLDQADLHRIVKGVS